MIDRRLRTSLLVTAAVAVVANASLASAASTWTVTPTPNPGGNQVSQIYFNGVSAASATDAYAVGVDQIGSTRRPLVERWDGRNWTVVDVPRPADRQSWFNDVLELSPTDVWVVGVSSSRRSENDDVRTLIEHWDGASWTIVPSPNPVTAGTSGDWLYGIDGVAPDDIWTVGSVLDEVHQQNVLLLAHWDGTQWRAAPTPSPDGAEQFGKAVVAIAPDDAWAVGTDALQKTLAAHWNGTRWRLVDSPSPQDGQNVVNSLTDVTATGPDDVWASGYEGNVDNQNFMKPYVLHWVGASWTLTFTPNVGGEGSRLNSIVALSPTDAWGVGQRQELNGGIFTFSERFDGTGWTIVPSPSPHGQGQLAVDALRAVAWTGTAGELFAVGTRSIEGQCCVRTLALVTSSG